MGDKKGLITKSTKYWGYWWIP